ncbi:acyl-CoA dehydrogenase [Chryseolinea sp. T2]|uniref:acyl-CoA dehydrogenase n=1 Tax=Chryseolinea sp. T2 TaxID=3129255 RepID=UPI0030784122
MPDWINKVLDNDVAGRLTAFAHAAEMRGDLHPRQLELLHEHRWFRMFIPKSFGGIGLTLPEVVRLEEALAWADGSTAWVATLCGGAGWFIGFVETAIVKEFFTGDRVCIAGSGSATGTAEVVAGGYRISGSWPFASGALHATAFTANCKVHENGHPKLGADGREIVLPFIFKPDEVEVKRTWGATGMIATASHSFSISDITVPVERCFEISPATAKLSDPVYQYPFLQLAEATLAANISGMTVRFLELIADNTSYPKNSRTCNELSSAHQSTVNKLRVFFSASVDQTWKQLIDSGKVEEVALRQVSQYSYELVRACRVSIDVLYALCSLDSGSREGELNRVWRNIDTALSHALFRKRLVAEMPSLSLATSPTPRA